MNLNKEIVENHNVLVTLLSPYHSNLAILITGEDYFQKSTKTIIRVYLITEIRDEWSIQTELESFAFSNYNSANKFINDLPGMSAIDLLILMNGEYKKKSELH